MTAVRKAKPPLSDPSRNRELGAIHLAKKQLALTDDSYRGLIARFSKGRTETSADLTGSERQAVIEYFRSVGFTRQAKAKTPVDRRADYRPQAMKIKALWFALYSLGAVRDPSNEAAEAFVCRHTKIQAMRWNYPEHLSLAIDCLRGWCGRYDYDPQPFKSLTGNAAQEGSFRPGLINAQFTRLEKLKGYERTQAGRASWLRYYKFEPLPLSSFQDDEADRLIQTLGREIRAAVQDAGTDG